LRRAEIGVHHHIAGAYRSRYPQKRSWREDHYQLNRVLRANHACQPATTSSRPARTRPLLGWQPTQPGLIADVDHPGYFKTRTDRAVATQLAARLSPIAGVAESR
jgi:hypothetical protein